MSFTEPFGQPCAIVCGELTTRVMTERLGLGQHLDLAKASGMNIDARSMQDESKVLIVDDAPESLAIIVETLEQDAVQVSVAQDAEEALMRADFLQPDLILLDVVMPGMSGFELCRRLKAAERTRDIPVIFMTASDSIHNKLAGFDAGAVDYVTKPLHIAEVRARVNAQLALRRMQRQLQRQNLQLQREIYERAQVEEQLRASNYELESFSYSASHDLRAPLRSISTQVGLLLESCTELDRGAKERLQKIVLATQRMDRLIQDLLEYARTGRRSTELAAVPLEPIVQRLLSTFAERIASEGARVDVIEPMATPLADPLLLEQLLANLLDNALKYRGAAPARVTLSAAHAGDQVQINVSDWGIGIDPAYHEKIFQVFQRLHTEQDYPGTGIGLAIVAKLARLMNGSVHLSSAPDQGSSFTITLAAAEESSDLPTGSRSSDV